MVLAVLLDGDARPVCSEIWPGKTADVTTVPVIDRLRRRFDIARVRVAADRGIISAETIAESKARQLLYILGVANAPISRCANWRSTIPPRSCCWR
jgi:hypothetical protein